MYGCLLTNILLPDLEENLDLLQYLRLGHKTMELVSITCPILPNPPAVHLVVLVAMGCGGSFDRQGR